MITKILIIQTAFIGDVILTLPVVQILKKNIECEIDFMCVPEATQIIKHNPLINEVIIYDKNGKDKHFKSFRRLSRRIRYKRYDIILSPHRSLRSTLLSYFSKSEKTISFDKSALSKLYTNRVNYIKNIHEIQRNLKLLEPLNIYEQNIIKPELFISEQDRKTVKLFFSTNKIYINNPFLTVAPGSIWNTKRFPEGGFIDIFNELKESNFPIILIGSKRDYELCQFIQDNTSNKNVFIAANKLSILHSIYLIQKSRLLLTNDSAPLHIGNAVGTKVFAFFGPTVPEFGFYPYNGDDKIFEIKDLECRPCGIHGGDECPKKHFRCMLDQDISKIVETIYAEFK